MAVGKAGEGVWVDMGLAEDGERLAAGDIARTRSNTSFVEQESRNESTSKAWGLGVWFRRWVTPRSGSRGMMRRSVNSGAWLGRVRKWVLGKGGLRQPMGSGIGWSGGVAMVILGCQGSGERSVAIRVSSQQKAARGVRRLARKLAQNWFNSRGNG